MPLLDCLRAQRGIDTSQQPHESSSDCALDDKGPCKEFEVICIVTLIGKGSTLMDYPPLHRAAYLGDVHTVRQLLASGCDANLASTLQNLNGQHIHGVTALYLAVQRVHDDVVEVLLAAGADPSARATTQDGQCFSAKDVAFNNMRYRMWRRLKHHEPPTSPTTAATSQPLIQEREIVPLHTPIPQQQQTAAVTLPPVRSTVSALQAQ